MFETFDHTADLGLRVKAPQLDELFVEAARGLMSILVDNTDSIQAVQSEELQIEGSEREYLFFDWLNELLYRFEATQMVYSKFQLQFDDIGIHATIKGERLDRRRHILSREVKAITYHGLKVEESSSGWLAEVIVDI